MSTYSKINPLQTIHTTMKLNGFIVPITYTRRSLAFTQSAHSVSSDTISVKKLISQEGSHEHASTTAYKENRGGERKQQHKIDCG